MTSEEEMTPSRIIMSVKMTLLCLLRSQLYIQYQPQQYPLLCCWFVQLLALLLSLLLLLTIYSHCFHVCV